MSCNECRDLAELVRELVAAIGAIHEEVGDLIDYHLRPRSESALFWDLCCLYEHTLTAVGQVERRLERTLPIMTVEELGRLRLEARERAAAMGLDPDRPLTDSPNLHTTE